MSAPIPEGPWKYEPETERVFGPRRELVCWMKPSRSEPDKAALNGAFIAAAPERIAALEAQVQTMREALAGAQVEGYWSLDGKQPTHWVVYVPIKESERSTASIASKREELAAALAATEPKL